MKLLYLGNALGQLFLMSEFLGFGLDASFGIRVLTNIWNGHDWKMSQVFPRVAFCLVPIRMLGSSSNAVTAQCALPTNMLNEKIYIFLWWWISTVAVVTLYSIMSWMFRFYHQVSRFQLNLLCEQSFLILINAFSSISGCLPFKLRNR